MHIFVKIKNMKNFSKIGVLLVCTVSIMSCSKKEQNSLKDSNTMMQEPKLELKKEAIAKVPDADSANASSTSKASVNQGPEVGGVTLNKSDSARK